MPVLIVIVGIVGSIVISFRVLSYLNIKSIKDLADKGYRKNVNPYDTTDMHEDERIKEYYIPLFFAGINIGTLLRILEEYHKYKSYSIQDLLMMNLIVAYTPEEQKRYDENKTIKTARAILKDAYWKENKRMRLDYINSQGLSTIWFQEYGDRYIITRSKGPVSKLSIPEQYATLNWFIAIKKQASAQKLQKQANNAVLDTPTSNNTHSQEIEAEKTELQRIRDNLTKPNNTLGKQLRHIFKRNNKQPRL